MEFILYEEVNRAHYDRPHIDLTQHNLQYAAHTHEELEFMFVADGAIDLHVGDQEHHLTKGDITVLLPFRIHSLETPAQSHVYIFKLLSAFFDFSAYVPDFLRFRQDDALYDGMYAGIMRMAEESRLDEDDPHRHLALLVAADDMLLRLSRLPVLKPVPPDLVTAQNRDIDLLKKISRYLQENFQSGIRLEDAARACHMSTYYFAHSFKRATGTTFGTYLNRFRLEQAKVRIMLDDALFTDIAMQCGFSSVRTFNRSFVNYYKITPSQAKKEWRK